MYFALEHFNVNVHNDIGIYKPSEKLTRILDIIIDNYINF
jgi:hypothetical protein